MALDSFETTVTFLQVQPSCSHPGHGLESSGLGLILFLDEKTHISR